MHLNCTPNTNLMNYMKAETILDKENYQFIKQAKYFWKAISWQGLDDSFKP
jgi:hypothetical protein